jgi:hypothetical protein
MRVKDPELLKKLREFCKIEARRMNADERAEIARREAAKTTSKTGVEQK